MKRFALVTLFASSLVGCLLGSGIDEMPGREDFPRPRTPTAADRRSLRMTADPSGRWVLAAAATSVMHRLVLMDMTTRTPRTFDDLAEVHAASFWTAERGHGIDVVSHLKVGDIGILRVISYDLDAGKIVFHRDIEGIPYVAQDPQDHRETLGVSSLDGTIVVRVDGKLIALDARTGADVGAFEPKNGSIATVRSVPTAHSLAVSTTAGAVVLRARDLSLRCSFEQTTLFDPTSEPAVVGPLAFLITPLPSNRPQVEVIDTDRCERKGFLQGAYLPKTVAVESGVAVIVDRDAPSPNAPALPESVTTSKTRFHLAVTDATTLGTTFVELPDDVVDLAPTGDGKKIVTFEAMGLHVVDVATRTASAPVPLYQPRPLVASPDGRTIYAIAQDKYTYRTVSMAIVDVNTATTTSLVRLPAGVEAVAPLGFDGVVIDASACIVRTLSTDCQVAFTFVDRAGAKVDVSSPVP